MEDKHCIDLLNYEGIRTIFTEEQRILKSDKHPELRTDNFIDRVKKTITKPEFVYEDYDEKNRYSYYCEEFKINSRVRYTKVMLLKLKNHYLVITAYRPDFVKERNRTKLLYGKDND